MKINHLAKRHFAQRFLKPADDAGGGGTATIDTPAKGADGDVAMPESLADSFLKARGSEDGDYVNPDDKAAGPPAKKDAPAKKEEPKKPEAKEKKELPKGADVPDAVLGKKEEPKTDAPVEKQPKNAGEWIAYKATRDAKERELNERITALAAELEATKKAVISDADRADYERLKKQTPELESIMERIALERSPKFITEFVKGRADLIDRAAKKLVQAGGDGHAFREALSLTGKARYEAIEAALLDTPTGVANQVHSMVSQLEDLDERRDATLEKGKVALEEFAAEEDSKARKTSEETLAAQQKRFGEVQEALKEDFFLLQKVEGNDKWNEMSENVVKGARDFIFNGTRTADDVFTAAIAAQCAPVFKQMYMKERELRQALQAELEAYTAGEPGLDNGGGAKTPAAPDDESLADAFSKARGA